MRNNLPIKTRAGLLLVFVCLMMYPWFSASAQYAYDPIGISLDISKNRVSLELKERQYKKVARTKDTKTDYHVDDNDNVNNFTITKTAKKITLEESLEDLSARYGMRFKQVNSTIHVVKDAPRTPEVVEVR